MNIVPDIFCNEMQFDRRN